MARGLKELQAELARLASKLEKAGSKLDDKTITGEELPEVSAELMLPNILKKEKLIESEEDARKRMSDEEYRKAMETAEDFGDSLAEWIEK